MNELISQVRRALDSELYYLALYVTLTLPDTLRALQSENGYATSDKYEEWFDEYVAPKYTMRGDNILDGEMCYNLRCSILHQGKIDTGTEDYVRVIFAEPEGGVIAHNNILNGALQIGIEEFCRDVLEGAEEWMDKYGDDEQVQSNYEEFMSRHPDGLSPYIKGMPVIT